MQNNKGQIVTYLLAIIFLIYFAGSLLLYLLYRQDLLRFEFGPKKVVEQPELVFDKNRVLELFKREELVAEKERSLEVEAMRLDSLQKEIVLERSKFAEDKASLTKAMEEISLEFQKLSEEEEQNLHRLAKLYEEMKAQRVAKIFAEMDEATVAQLLVRMQSKSASKIMGEIGVMDAERAARISDIIKGKFKRDMFEKIP
jgi:flagellar motility protein MotE (MotC chaperone)